MQRGKNGGSTSFSITLKNLDWFIYFLHCCKQEEIFYTRMKKCYLTLILYVCYLVKMNITFHTYIMHSQNKFTCCIKHDVKHKVHQVQRKQIDSHKVCSKCLPGRQICVCVRARLTFLTLNQFFHSRNHSCAMCVVCRFPQTIKLTSFLRNSQQYFSFFFVSGFYQEIPESVIEHHSLLIPVNF